MSDWIDDLKQRDQDVTDEARRRENLRLHRAKIIEAKAPAFWKAVIQQVEKDCSKLRETFRDDTSRQCEVSINGETLQLRGRRFPSRIISLSPNFSGQCIEVREAKQLDQLMSPIVEQTASIKVTANADEEIDLEFMGRRYSMPASLSEALVKRTLAL